MSRPFDSISCPITLTRTPLEVRLARSLVSMTTLTVIERPPHTSLPISNVAAGPTQNMEFEPYPRQHFAMGPFADAGALDMSNMAAALPDYQMRQFQQQPFTQHYQSPGAANQSVMYQYHPGAQFAGQTASSYGHSFAQQYPSQYVQGAQSRQQHGGAFPQFMGNPGGPQPFQNQTFMLQQPVIHSPNTMPQHQQHQQAQFPASHANPAYGGSYGPRVGAVYTLPQLRLDNSLAQPQSANFYPHSNPEGMIIRMPMQGIYSNSSSSEKNQLKLVFADVGT